jgi:3-isopropylmalate/(R)-2-methylmalate dehydratase small subunit
MSATIRGRVWKFGDNIDTDQIMPGKYLKLSRAEAVPHVMEGIDPEFARKVRPGDIIVAGANFGSGSSRESAATALKDIGVGAVVAKFFARIFFRNAINFALPVLECAETDRISEGDDLEVLPEEGLIINHTTGERFQATKLPPQVLEILRAGGLVPYLRERIARERAEMGNRG